MQGVEQKWGLYSVAAAGGGLVLAALVGLVLPPVLAVFLLIASQFVALVIGVTARTTLAGRVGLVASSALLLVGVLIGLPHLVGSAPAVPPVPPIETGVASTDPAPTPSIRPADGSGSGGAPDPGPAEDPAAGQRPATGRRPTPRDPSPGELFPKVPFGRKP